MPKNANEHPGLTKVLKLVECTQCSIRSLKFPLGVYLHPGLRVLQKSLPTSIILWFFENPLFQSHPVFSAWDHRQIFWIITYETKSLGAFLTLKHLLESRWRMKLHWGCVVISVWGEKSKEALGRSCWDPSRVAQFPEGCRDDFFRRQ